MNYHFEITSWKTHGKVIKELRHEVCVFGADSARTFDVDKDDFTAQHLLVRDIQNHIIAVARLTEDGEISRIAIKHNHRHLKLYKSIFTSLQRIALEKSLEHVRIRCNLSGVEKLAKNGYVPTGKVFMEAGIPVQNLSFPTTYAPPLLQVNHLH